MYFLVKEAGRNRPAHTGQDGDIERLTHAAFKLDPLDNVSRSEVDDLHAAPRVGVSLNWNVGNRMRLG